MERPPYIGVHEGRDRLTHLAGRVEAECEKLGFPAEERPFAAHLTIGRVRSQAGIARLVKRLQVAEFQGRTPAPVSRVLLFQSTLGPHGPAYTPLAEIPLA